MKIKNCKRLIALTTSLVFGITTFPMFSNAQEVEEDYDGVFSPAEWQIIEKEVRRKPNGHDFGFSTYRLPIMNNYSASSAIIDRGGSGENRWVLFDLGTDDLGNRYFVHTGQKITVGSSSYNFISIVYASPHNGAYKRRIAMSNICSQYLDTTRIQQENNSRWEQYNQRVRNQFGIGSGGFNSGLSPSSFVFVPHPYMDILWAKDYPVAYKDYDSNGKLIRSGRFSSQYQERMKENVLVKTHVKYTCYAAYGLPMLKRLFAEGRSNNSTPSIYD